MSDATEVKNQFEERYEDSAWFSDNLNKAAFCVQRAANYADAQFTQHRKLKQVMVGFDATFFGMGVTLNLVFERDQ